MKKKEESGKAKGKEAAKLQIIISMLKSKKKKEKEDKEDSEED